MHGRLDKMRGRDNSGGTEGCDGSKTITTPLEKKGRVEVLNQIEKVLTLTIIRADMDKRVCS
jgi:hypothetical protein